MVGRLVAQLGDLTQTSNDNSIACCPDNGPSDSPGPPRMPDSRWSSRIIDSAAINRHNLIISFSTVQHSLRLFEWYPGSSVFRNELSMLRYFLAFLSLSLLAGSGWPNRIVVGEHVLQANLPEQEIEILVTGDTSVSGLDLFVQIGDGGPELADFGLPRGHRGPHLTHVELIQGTIFDRTGESPTNIGVPELSQIAMYTLAPVGAVPSVPAQGTLVKLTLDTTGMYHGSWDLLLSGVLPHAELNGPYNTNFAGMPADIENGRVTIVVSIGDYNGNGYLDAQDVDQLAEAIRVGSDDPRFDVTEDGAVNGLDHRYWVGSVARTYLGDANLDGEFNSSDMVQVFASGGTKRARVPAGPKATGTLTASSTLATWLPRLSTVATSGG